MQKCVKAIGKLFVVGVPIGNLEDITLRALRVLSSVDVIAAEDTRRARFLLEQHRIAKKPLLSFFVGNETSREQELLAKLHAGQKLALITDAGMPGVSDPGQGLVAQAVAQGLPVEVIPGPSAFLHALIASGLPMARFLFVGFPPKDEGPRLSLFGSLRGEVGTLVFYETKERLVRTLADLALALGEHRQAVVARELTKQFEQHLRGTLAELSAQVKAQPLRGEITLVVAGHDGKDGQPGVATIDIEAEIRRRLQKGDSAKDIASAMTLLTGQSRRKLYQLTVSLGQNACRDASWPETT